MQSFDRLQVEFCEVICHPRHHRNSTARPDLKPNADDVAELEAALDEREAARRAKEAEGALLESDNQAFDTGWSVTAAFGVNLGNGLSVELESGYFEADVEGFEDETEFALGSLVGDITMVPILANVKYTAPVTSLFNFYVGAGIGTLYSESSVDIGPFSAGSKDWDFGFQGFAGISIPMSEILTFDAGYRFLANGFSNGDIRSHSVEAGITFRF